MTTEKLQQIRESFSKSINSAVEKVFDLEKTVDGKLVLMEEEINNLQSQQPEQVRIVSEDTGRIKTACFDSVRIQIPI